MFEALLSRGPVGGWTPDPDGNSWASFQPGWVRLGDGPVNTPYYGNCFGAYAGKLYTFSGAVNKTELYRYDSTTTLWTKLPDGALSKDYAASCFCKGIFYVHGGYDVAGSNTTNNVMRKYNPTTNGWTTAQWGPTKRAQHGMISTDNKIFLYGGYGNTAIDRLSDMWCYEPTSGQWTQMASGPVAVTQFGMAGMGKKVYIFGGYSGAGTDNFLEFDTETNIWTALPKAPAARYSPTLTEVGGLLYLFGGLGSGGVMNDLWVYDPNTTVWTQVVGGTFPAARRLHNAAKVQNRLVIYGGVVSGATRDMWVYTPQIM